jgi:uncharacterized membrane protein YjfL (UPF0719 family)
VSGLDGSDPQYLTVIRGALFYAATTPHTGTELWRHGGDGAVAGLDGGAVLGLGLKLFQSSIPCCFLLLPPYGDFLTWIL